MKRLKVRICLVVIECVRQMKIGSAYIVAMSVSHNATNFLQNPNVDLPSKTSPATGLANKHVLAFGAVF